MNPEEGRPPLEERPAAAGREIGLEPREAGMDPRRLPWPKMATALDMKEGCPVLGEGPSMNGREVGQDSSEATIMSPRKAIVMGPRMAAMGPRKAIVMGQRAAKDLEEVGLSRRMATQVAKSAWTQLFWQSFPASRFPA
jgi:hypothetical protein